jgi:mannosyl-3-phosphoglycerate phosphatase
MATGPRQAAGPVAHILREADFMTIEGQARQAERASRPPAQLVVFSDLDGTLLDEHYRHDAADTALARLHAAGIPLVLTSSKTRAEMLGIRATLAPGQPIIFENGCGIATPATDAGDEAVERFGPDYGALRAVIAEVRAQTGARFRGFGDMSDEEVAERTGLPIEDARLARAREASEPGVFDGGDEDLETFRAALAARDLRLVRGGRFLHVMPPTDKADAVRRVAERLRDAHPSTHLVTIVAGDSENDADMLRAADRAVVVRRADGSWLELDRAQDVLRSTAIGPAGWAECVDRLLDEFLPDSRQAGRTG